MTAKDKSLDLMREVLDHEMVDVDGVTCGMVDDVELGAAAHGRVEVRALLVGPGAWLPRLPAIVEAVLGRLLHRGVVRVPWDEVADVSEVIRLRSRASSLGLGRADRKAERWLAKLPKA